MDTLAALASSPFLGKPTWTWLAFASIVAALLTLDLGCVHRRHGEIGVAASLRLSACYLAVGIAFGGGVWVLFGGSAGVQYFTGFVIEKSLSLDNVFVISLVFSYFAIPRAYQHRVLFWGVLGAILLRGLAIAGGTTLLARFAWTLFVFAAFLVFTGLHMLLRPDAAPTFEHARVQRFLMRTLHVTDRRNGGRFWVRDRHPRAGHMVWHATPLFVALCTVEIADIMFAMDSVPAIFAVTTDPFLVYTSNVFAVLGLRALYFALSAVVHRFADLRYALAALLVFIGGKIFWGHLFGEIDARVSLAVTLTLIAGGTAFSLYRSRSRAAAGPHPAAPATDQSGNARLRHNRTDA